LSEMDKRMTGIPSQLPAAASVLPNATHVIFTVGENVRAVADSLIQVVINNNLINVVLFSLIHSSRILKHRPLFKK
jgi:hypothetical protein